MKINTLQLWHGYFFPKTGRIFRKLACKTTSGHRIYPAQGTNRPPILNGFGFLATIKLENLYLRLLQPRLTWLNRRLHR